MGTSVGSKVQALRAELAGMINESMKPGYVYTYPPKRAFRPLPPDFSLEQVWQDKSTDGVNIYIHVPFCQVRCRFCNLFMVPMQDARRSLADAYTDALVKEIQRYGELIGSRKVESIYFGGGTPTFLTLEQFQRIFAQLHESFPQIAPDIEQSVEAYPDDAVDPTKLQGLRALGVNRISFGIQTFDPAELEATGRRYPAELGLEVVERVKALGFADVNIDLIYGLPGQTEESWEQNLHVAGRLGSTTITIYPLMIRPVTAYDRQKEMGKVAFVKDDTKFAWYEIGRRILREYGYQQENTVRFVKPGLGGYRQQAKEFSGTPTVGFGPGARSSAPNCHYSTDYAVAYAPSMEIIQNYIQAIEEGRPAAVLGFYLNRDENIRRTVVQQIQLPAGLDTAAFAAKYGVPLGDLFAAELQALALEGCVAQTDDGRIVFTEKGRKYSDICVHLFFSDAVRQLEAEYVPV